MSFAFFTQGFREAWHYYEKECEKQGKPLSTLATLNRLGDIYLYFKKAAEPADAFNNATIPTGGFTFGGTAARFGEDEDEETTFRLNSAAQRHSKKNVSLSSKMLNYLPTWVNKPTNPNFQTLVQELEKFPSFSNDFGNLTPLFLDKSDKFAPLLQVR